MASNYAEAAFLAWMTRATAMPSAPANLYVSLHTGDPADTGANEIAGGSYARVAIAATSGWTAIADNGTVKQTANVAAINFPTATGNWGTITHAGLWDASTGGNFMDGGALDASLSISSGDIASLPAGALILQGE